MMSDVNFNVVLFRPEIPQNTGNIGRLCVGTHCRLHLVHPLGFDLSEKQLRRAGLDYWQHLDVREHENWQPTDVDRTFFFSKKATRSVFDIEFMPGDTLVFGSETKGLPDDMRFENQERCVALPHYGPVRSHNLANSVSAAVYLGLKDLHDRGLAISAKPLS
ncbi:MAG: tRNA (cytidine(34)-2'-O)-methyltransferase [Planctomycetes bacterium]|nr:tRNA (cytidine(34)-2'-O)-methyltransferase [Planctomycetota bacterium]